MESEGTQKFKNVFMGVMIGITLSSTGVLRCVGGIISTFFFTRMIRLKKYAAKKLAR